MQNLIRPVASLSVLAIFLLIALATGGSSNTTVASKECKPYANPIDVSAITVNLYVNHKNGQPVQGATGKLFVSRQIIVDTTDCSFLIADIRTFNITTDATGYYDHNQVGGTNFSDGDLWLVEVDIPAKPGVHEGFRDREVLNGASNIANFNFTSPNPL